MSYLYSVLNSATDIWSGAIDVCAVKRKDGSILCTPFYIRFGRLKVLDSGEKTIRIMVNEKLTDMCMKIGSNGIAYFVHESEDPIPDEQRVTSPVLTGQITPGNSKDVFDSMAHVKEKRKSRSPSPVKKPDEIIFTFDDLMGNTPKTKETPNTGDDDEANPNEVITTQQQQKSFFSWLFGSKANKTNLDQRPIEEEDTTTTIDQPSSLQKTPRKRKKHGAFLQTDPFIEQTFEEALVQQYNYPMGDSSNSDEESGEASEDEDIPYEDDETTPPLTKKQSFSKDLSVNIPYDQKNKYEEAEDNFNLSTSPTDVGFSPDNQLTPSLPPNMQKNIDAMYEKYNNANTDTPAQKSSWTNWIWGSSSKKVKVAMKNSKAPVVVPKSADMSRLKKSSRPTSEQLKALDLKEGPNALRFVVTSRVMGTQDILATLYLFDEDDKIIISDVDGTITRSDGLGHVLPMFGMDWAHQGICELYSKIVKNGYKIVYLTARSIVQAAQTKQYIQGVEQRSENNQWRLPDGPVIMSEDRLLACLHREVIQRKPEEFKIQVLKQILRLFPEEKREKVFYAGFGNRKTDAISYKAVHVPYHHIYIISPSGKIVVYDSVGHNSYKDINAIVDQTFPDTRMNKETNVGYWQLDIPSVASVEDLSKMRRTLSFHHPNIEEDDTESDYYYDDMDEHDEEEEEQLADMSNLMST
mmetsp:Transcript_736/g.1138  ORF Transcript_736/g.1138 Transcript_736/m.1138 type:complete len:693 (+) Transcript_736:1963-4041(+)